MTSFHFSSDLLLDPSLNTLTSFNLSRVNQTDQVFYNRINVREIGKSSNIEGRTAKSNATFNHRWYMAFFAISLLSCKQQNHIEQTR